MTRNLFLFCLFLFLTHAPLASAQTPAPAAAAVAAPQPAQAAAPVSSYSAQETASQILYSKTDASSIAKAYWSLTNMDSKNDKLIDQYLIVTECSLYTEFFKNDFEWNKIRDATRSYIESNKKFFPRRFEFVQPIWLDRYDPVAGGFIIEEDSKFVGVKKIQISENEPRSSPCTDSATYNQRLLPINALLNIARPLNYTFTKADKSSAEEYIKYLADNKAATGKNGSRPAYIRFRLKVQQSLDQTDIDHYIAAGFYGTLESIAVFGDREMFIKLDEQKY